MRISSRLFPNLERRIAVASSSASPLVSSCFASFSTTPLSTASPFLSSLSSSSFTSFRSFPTSSRLSLLPFLPSRSISFFTKAFEGVGSNTPPKTHSEKRILQYSPQQIYSVVSNVDDYKKFVPACLDSKVLKRYEGNKMEAELSVGYGPVNERYVSKIDFEPQKYVEAKVDSSSLFHFLSSKWEFEVIPDKPNQCSVTFQVSFAFRSELYRRMTESLFDDICNQTINAFEERCRKVYGTSKKH